MTPRERVLAVLLNGERPDKVPFTVYTEMIPQCAVERRLRNEGLCIVTTRAQPYVEKRPNCRTETHTYTEDGKPRIRRITRTPVGEVSSVDEPAGFTSWHKEFVIPLYNPSGTPLPWRRPNGKFRKFWTNGEEHVA